MTLAQTSPSTMERWLPGEERHSVCILKNTHRCCTVWKIISYFFHVGWTATTKRNNSEEQWKSSNPLCASSKADYAVNGVVCGCTVDTNTRWLHIFPSSWEPGCASHGMVCLSSSFPASTQIDLSVCLSPWTWWEIKQRKNVDRVHVLETVFLLLGFFIFWQSCWVEWCMRRKQKLQQQQQSRLLQQEQWSSNGRSRNLAHSDFKRGHNNNNKLVTKWFRNLLETFVGRRRKYDFDKKRYIS